MKKFLSLSTIALAVLCVSGNGHFSNTLLFVESHTWTSYFLAGVILLLITLLVVDPPRPKRLRVTSAAAGAFLGSLATYGLFIYELGVLEWVVLMETAIVLVIEALEFNVEYEEVLEVSEAKRLESSRRPAQRVIGSNKVRLIQ